jgi:hypothetical protein
VGRNDFLYLLGGDNRLQTLRQALDFVQRQTDTICAGHIRVTLNRRNALTPALAACDYRYLRSTTGKSRAAEGGVCLNFSKCYASA